MHKTHFFIFFIGPAQTNRKDLTRQGRVAADAGSFTRFVSGLRTEADEKLGGKRWHRNPARQHYIIANARGGFYDPHRHQKNKRKSKPFSLSGTGL